MVRFDDHFVVVFLLRDTRQVFKRYYLAKIQGDLQETDIQQAWQDLHYGTGHNNVVPLPSVGKIRPLVRKCSGGVVHLLGIVYMAANKQAWRRVLLSENMPST